jgi:hypothetical protein
LPVWRKTGVKGLAGKEPDGGVDAAEFLRARLRPIPGKLPVMWDGAAMPRRLRPDRLPAHARELNPVEYLRSRLKQHEIPNLLARDARDPGHHATRTLRRMRRRPRISRACWVQTELCL